MSEDQGYSLPAMAVRKMVQVIKSLEEVARHFEGQDYLFQGIRFLASNSKHMLEEDHRDLWKKTDLRGTPNTTMLTHDVTILIWSALSLGRSINQWRETVGLKPIDWPKAALEIDQAERRSHGKRTNL